MKIYRAVLSYNNGDYNEWEKVYDLTSEWYTSKEEAEKHLEELDALSSWLKYKHRNNCNFCAGNPRIEESEVLEKVSPLNTEIISLEETFDYSKFKYINEVPPLEIKRLLSRTALSNSIGSWIYEAQVGNEIFDVHFSIYADEGESLYSIEPSTDEENKDSKFWLYSPEVQDQIIKTIEGNVVNPILHLFQEERHAWDEFHQKYDDDEERHNAWHKCRLLELQITTEGIATVGAEISEYAVETLKRRREECIEAEDEMFNKEIAYINIILNSLK